MEIPPSYNSVKDHFDQVLQDPSISLDVSSLEKLQTELIANTNPSIPTSLLTKISQLLPILQEDPSPLTTLGIKAASYLNYTQIKAINPPLNLLAGIAVPSPPVNLLVLSLLDKAKNSAINATEIAEDSELVSALVNLWLCTETTAVAESAFNVIWSLLEVDHAGEPDNNNISNGNGDKQQQKGQGSLWRRIFDDKNIYGRIFSICSLTSTQPQMSIREKTIAQGRLMDLLVKVGSLGWDVVTASHFPEIESSFKSTSLLDFAVSKMVDAEDILLQMTHINFLSQLLLIGAPGIRQRSFIPGTLRSEFSSPSLDFLISSQVHDKIIRYYLEPSVLDPSTASYILGPVMGYVSQYTILYPNHLLEQPQSFLDRLLSRISSALAIPSAQWAHGNVPSGDLNLLASLPRVLLLEARRRSIDPISLIPSNPANKYALDTLGRIFRGPPSSQEWSDGEAETLDKNPTSPRAEAAAARILYLYYLNSHYDLWNNIVAAADVLAIQDVALAAIAFIRAVLSANWVVIPPSEGPTVSTNSRFGVPSEDEVGRLGPATQGMLPASGAWALLVPPALTAVFPYLFKPPQTYANFVAGGASDTESAVWRIASAKYDTLVALQSALVQSDEKLEGLDEIIQAINRRVADGPWGPPTQVGSRIEALEL